MQPTLIRPSGYTSNVSERQLLKPRGTQTLGNILATKWDVIAVLMYQPLAHITRTRDHYRIVSSLIHWSGRRGGAACSSEGQDQRDERFVEHHCED